MVNYKKSTIYKIVSLKTTDYLIDGCSNNVFSNRLCDLRNVYLRPRKPVKKHGLVLLPIFTFFKKYGIDSCKIIVIRKVSVNNIDELNTEIDIELNKEIHKDRIFKYYNFLENNQDDNKQCINNQDDNKQENEPEEVKESDEDICKGMIDSYLTEHSKVGIKIYYDTFHTKFVIKYKLDGKNKSKSFNHKKTGIERTFNKVKTFYENL